MFAVAVKSPAPVTGQSGIIVPRPPNYVKRRSKSDNYNVSLNTGGGKLAGGTSVVGRAWADPTLHKTRGPGTKKFPDKTLDVPINVPPFSQLSFNHNDRKSVQSLRCLAPLFSVFSDEDYTMPLLYLLCARSSMAEGILVRWKQARCAAE